MCSLREVSIIQHSKSVTTTKAIQAGTFQEGTWWQSASSDSFIKLSYRIRQ